jgi:signal transduction histidine kinase
VLFAYLDRRPAALVRILGLALITWTIFSARHEAPATHGRGLVVLLLYVACALAWCWWIVRPTGRGLTPDVYLMAGAGGFLTAAAPNSAASAFVFVAVVASGMRTELSQAAAVAGSGALALGVSILIYNGSGLGLLAYSLGFAAALLGASNARQSLARADQAELLLAQSQRSHEEQVRAARLEESARIARDIHDVLAHALAGLTLQLEATSTLLDQGADRDTIKARVDRAHALAREGLHETRRAVGALRGDPVAAPADLESLVDEYRAAGDGDAELTIDGDRSRLVGPVGEAVFRVVQEALTNVRKHAPGARVAVAVDAGLQAGDEVRLVVEDHVVNGAALVASGLSGTGGGYGLQGMRERAGALGGSVEAGATDGGWRVELRLPGVAR